MNQYCIVALLAALCLSIPAVCAAEVPETGPATFYPDTTIVSGGQPACTIVHPEDPAWGDHARALVAALRARYGVEFPSVPHTQVCPREISPIDERWRETNLIVLGNVHVNRAMLGFYAGFALGADTHYPGAGGYELRTICNPWGNGHNVIVIGASTPEDMPAAAARLVEMLPEAAGGEAVLPLTLEVRPGEGFETVFSTSAAEAERWEFKGFATRDHVASKLYATALRYHWTGDERWAAAVRDVMGFFNEVYDGRYPISDYEFDPWFRGWDLIDEHPVFTEQERQLTARRMMETALKVQGFAHLGPGYAGTRHTTQGTMGGWTAARYLRRSFPDEEVQAIAREWEAGCREHFEYVFSDYRDDRDSTESMDSIVSYVRRALEEGMAEYFESGHARQAAQYCLTYHDSPGYTCGIDGYAEAVPGSLRTRYRLGYVFRALTMALHDPDMLWLQESFPPCQGFGLHYWPALWEIGCFAPAPGAQASAGPPEYLLGLTALPVSERRYQQILAGQGRLAPGVSMDMPPREQTVDKLCFREGFGPEDQYLLLQGFQGCLVGTVDGNTIPRYTERGTVWLFHHTDQIGHYFRNGLFVSNGVNDGTLPAACRLDAAGRFADLSMAATTLQDYRGTDWQRAVFWQPGDWFLVMDRAMVKQPGQYLAQCIWRTPLFGSWEQDRHFATTSGAATFHIVSSHPVAGRAQAEAPDGAARPFVLRQRKSGDLQAGEVIDFQNLLCVTDADARPPFTPLRVTGSAAVIVGPGGERLLVGVGGGPPACGVTCDAGLFAIGAAAAHVAGVKRLEVDGQVVFETPEPLTARLDLTTGRVTGGHDGAALMAASLTWRLAPAEVSEVGVNPAPLRAVATAISRVQGGDGALADDTPDATAAPVRVVWESEEIGRKGRPIEGMRITTHDEVSGPLEEAMDGMVPSWNGPLSWPKGLPAGFEVSWPGPRLVDELRIHVGMIAARDRPDLAEPVEGAREVGLVFSSDGFAQDLRERTVSADLHVDLRNPGKGYIDPQGHLRVRVGGIEASAVRVIVPPAAEGAAVYLPEVEVLTDRRGPVEIGHLLVEDLDGDGEPEIIAETDGGLLSVLGADGALRWQHRFPGPLTEVIAGDLSGDGRRELVCGCFDDCVYALSATGEVLWTTSFVGMREQSNSKYCENGSVAHTVGFWEPRPGVRRILVGHYWYMSVLDEGGKLLQCARVAGRHRVALQPALDLDGDGARELLVSWDMPWQGTAGVTIAGDAEGIQQGRIPTPNGIAWLAEVIEGEVARVVLGTGEGFGLYDVPERKALWEYRGGRPFSAGARHDTDGDGEPELLIGGRDGFVTVFSLAGEALGAHLVGDAVNDLALLGTGTGATCLVATASGLQAFDAQWRPLGSMTGEWVKLAALGADGRAVVALTADGRLHMLRGG